MTEGCRRACAIIAQGVRANERLDNIGIKSVNAINVGARPLDRLRGKSTKNLKASGSSCFRAAAAPSPPSSRKLEFARVGRALHWVRPRQLRKIEEITRNM